MPITTPIHTKRPGNRRVLSTVVPDAIADAVREAARKDRTSVSALIAQVIIRALQSE